MAVRKDETKGKWLAEAYIEGKRKRKWFESKSEALRYYNAIKQENSPLYKLITTQTHEEPMRLSELVQLWYDLHGQTLARGDMYREKLSLMAQAFGDIYAKDFTVEMFADYRKKRLNGEIVFKNTKHRTQVKESTINFEHSSFKAMFNELKRFGKFKGENPLNGLKQFREKELIFLRGPEIDRLLNACAKINNDLLLVVKLCLATGARWSEAVNMKSSQLIPHKVTFIKTKGGKNRTVPISKALYDELPKKQGHLFKEATPFAFRQAIKMANIELPENQLTHVLRHSFASHFMMNGGNILVLKQILGHSDIQMTMVYSHFAPSHLESALTFNPLENRQNGGD